MTLTADGTDKKKPTAGPTERILFKKRYGKNTLCFYPDYEAGSLPSQCSLKAIGTSKPGSISESLVHGNGHDNDGIAHEQTPLLGHNKSASPAQDENFSDGGDSEEEIESQPEPPVSWRSIPNKGQLAMIVFARLAEPLAARSLSSYLFYQLRWFDPSLPDSSIANQAGLLTAAFSAAQCVTAMFWGHAADSPLFGRKRVLLIGLLGTCISALGMGFARSYGTAVFFRCVQGALNGNIGVLRTMVSEIIVDKRYQSRAFLLLPMCFNVGVIIGPLIGGFLADPVASLPNVFGPGSLFGGRDGVAWMQQYPYALPNLVCAVLLTVAAIGVILGLDETHPMLRHKPDRGRKLGTLLVRTLFRKRDTKSRDAHLYAPIANNNNNTDEPEAELLIASTLEESDGEDVEAVQRQPKQGMQEKAPLRRLCSRNVILTLIQHHVQTLHVSSFNTLLFTMLPTPRSSNENAHLPFQFTGGLGMSSRELGFANTIIGCVGIPLQILLFPYLSAKLGIRNSYRLFLPFSALAYFALPYLVLLPDQASILWPFLSLDLVFHVFARVFVGPATIMLVNECAPHPTLLGTVHGVAQSASSAARMLGPAIAGLVLGWGLQNNIVGLPFWIITALAVDASFEVFFWTFELAALVVDKKSMSLAQHVTATEGVDREDPQLFDDEFGEPRWRRLSFDAFAPIDHSALPEADPAAPHIAAYKISPARRIAQITFAVIVCCLASGIVFGFASLKPVLIAEGVYRELCPINTPEDGEDPFEVPCTEQDLRLNLFFIAASITTNVSSLFAGATLDRFGRRVCYVASALFIAIGCVLMGYAFAIPEFDGYLVGNIFLGLGGTFLFVPSFQLANAFPKHSGLVVAIITGAFDASAAVFLFYRLAWEATEHRFEPSHFFFAFLAVSMIILVGEFTLMPTGAYHSTPELEHKIEKVQDPMRDVHDSDQELSDGELYRVRSNRAESRQAKLDRLEELVGDVDTREERALIEEERHVASGIWGVLHGLPAHKQMLTPWFILILLLTVLQMLRMNYFIATIRAQYRFMLGSEEHAEAINNFFDVALPIGGILATPFTGALLNHMSVATVLAVLTGYIAVIGVLNCLPFVWAGYATVISFVLFRPLYYSAVSDYVTKVFGFATFGRVYGMITCLSGLVNFSQSGLDALTHGPLEGDPTPINAVMAVIGTLIGIALTGYVFIKSRAFDVEVRQEHTRQENVRQERMALIREDTAEYGTLV
ncbi:Protein FMP42-like protein 2 [Seiridium cupressi]